MQVLYFTEEKMKKIILIAAAALTVSLISGCASSKNLNYGQSSTAMARELGAPDWYFRDIKDDKGIYAVGRADFSDEIVSEKAARVDGRARLAQMLESAMNYIGENSASADTETKKAFKENTKQITNQILVGSMMVDRFDIDGKVSVLMFQPYEDLVKKVKSQAMKQDNEKLKNFMADLTVEQFRDAVDNTVAE